MSPDEILASLSSLGPQDLAQLKHWQLYAARGKSVDPAVQKQLAPFEHRAFARESVRDAPWMAPGALVNTLGYQPYKALMGESRSGVDLGQMKHGLIGVGEGLWAAFKDALPERPAPRYVQALSRYSPPEKR